MPFGLDVPPLTPKRVLGLSLFFFVTLALALHVALLVSWHTTIAPELEASSFPEQLDRDTITRFPAPAADWPLLVLEDLSLRAPLEDATLDIATICVQVCQVALDRGKLTLFNESLDKPYVAQAIELTPDRDEIGWFRSPLHNWRVIQALAARVTLPGALPDTERYVTPRSRGVLTHFHSNDNDRWVIYAYAKQRHVSRKLAVSGVSRDTLLALLASLDFSTGR